MITRRGALLAAGAVASVGAVAQLGRSSDKQGLFYVLGSIQCAECLMALPCEWNPEKRRAETECLNKDCSQHGIKYVLPVSRLESA